MEGALVPRTGDEKGLRTGLQGMGWEGVERMRKRRGVTENPGARLAPCVDGVPQARPHPTSATAIRTLRRAGGARGAASRAATRRFQSGRRSLLRSKQSFPRARQTPRARGGRASREGSCRCGLSARSRAAWRWWRSSSRRTGKLSRAEQGPRRRTGTTRAGARWGPRRRAPHPTWCPAVSGERLSCAREIGRGDKVQEKELAIRNNSRSAGENIFNTHFFARLHDTRPKSGS
jgi:hypothetical protein